MELDLTVFSSIFEIFAGLNIAFAGSDRFKAGLTDFFGGAILHNLDKINFKIRNQIINQRTQSNRIILMNAGASAMVQRILKEFSIESRWYRKTPSLFKKSISIYEQFYKGFVTMFFISGVYCIFILALIGYKQFYEKNYCINHCYSHWMIGAKFILIVNLFFFLRSFKKSYLDKSLNIIATLFIIALFLVISSLIGLEAIKHKMDTTNAQREIVNFAILAAISPYLFHLIRAGLHYFYYVIFKINLLIFGSFVLIQKTKFEIDVLEESCRQHLFSIVNGVPQQASINKAIKDITIVLKRWLFNILYKTTFFLLKKL